MKCLEHINFMPKSDKISGYSNSGRTRSDNCYLFPGGFRYGRYFNLYILPFPVGKKTFKAPNSYRFIFYSNYAFYFTLFFLGAYTTTNSRKNIFFLKKSNPFFEFFFSNKLYKPFYINFNRAALDTFWIFTLQATFSFNYCFLRRITVRYFIVVLFSLPRRLFPHRGFYRVYFCHNTIFPVI